MLSSTKPVIMWKYALTVYRCEGNDEFHQIAKQNIFSRSLPQLSGIQVQRLPFGLFDWRKSVFHRVTKGYCSSKLIRKRWSNTVAYRTWVGQLIDPFIGVVCIEEFKFDFRKYDEAMEVISAHGGRYSIVSVARLYLDHLIALGQYENAAKLCLRAFGNDKQLWEEEVYKFVRAKQLR